MSSDACLVLKCFLALVLVLVWVAFSALFKSALRSRTTIEPILFRAVLALLLSVPKPFLTSGAGLAQDSRRQEEREERKKGRKDGETRKRKEVLKHNGTNPKTNLRPCKYNTCKEYVFDIYVIII